jgi:hypothetical protein
MKQRLWIVSQVTLTLVLLTGPAFAGGWGPYFSWGQEKASTGFPGVVIDALRDLGLPENVIQDVEAADVDVSLNHLTFGVMYESAPARDKLMSYRGTLGFDIATSLSVDDVSIPSLPIDIDGLGLSFEIDESSKYGLSTNHTLAFGIIRTDRLKWWVGPGIGLTANYYDYSTDLYGIPIDAKAGNISIGGGGETGVNLHLGPGMTLCVGGGIHWRAFAYGGGAEDVGSLVWGNGPLYFVQVSLLFRTGPDRYHQDASEPGQSERDL